MRTLNRTGDKFIQAYTLAPNRNNKRKHESTFQIKFIRSTNVFWANEYPHKGSSNTSQQENTGTRLFHQSTKRELSAPNQSDIAMSTAQFS
jgi:hypothetical protein